MPKEKKISAKEKIIHAAWDLFMAQGYEHTTINEIIAASQTSRGSFYHHFRGKEDLLFCLAYFFDDDYNEFLNSLEPDTNVIERLHKFDTYVLHNLEESPYKYFLPALYGYQVMTEGTRHILNSDRGYYHLIAKWMKEGLEKGELESTLSYMELTKRFSMIERGLTYDWCLNKFSYSLVEYGQDVMNLFLNSLCPLKHDKRRN